MTEELGKDLLVESTKAVVVEVYKDTLHPGFKAVGNIVALPFQAIDAALSRPKLWVAEKQYNFERTRTLLGEKLKNIPPEKIVPPENYVAIPALQQISYCFDSDELRDMYANLLAASMQEDKKWAVHPAYVDIIKQLTPDEAKLLKCLRPSLYVYYPVLDVIIGRNEGGFRAVCLNYTDIAVGICDCPENIGAYLDNLSRLKLIVIEKDKSVHNQEEYKRLRETDVIQQIVTRELQEGESFDYKKGCFRLTEFGLNFIKTCM